MVGDDNYRGFVEGRIHSSGGDPTAAVEDRPYVFDGTAHVDGEQRVSTRNLRKERGEAEEGEEPDCVEMMEILSGEKC